MDQIIINEERISSLIIEFEYKNNFLNLKNYLNFLYYN